MGDKLQSISLFTVVDMNNEEFNEFCSDKGLGYIKSLIILLNSLFNQCAKTKDSLLNKVLVEGSIENNESFRDLLFKLYDKMQMLEDKSIYLHKLYQERLKDTN